MREREEEREGGEGRARIRRKASIYLRPIFTGGRGRGVGLFRSGGIGRLPGECVASFHFELTLAALRVFAREIANPRKISSLNLPHSAPVGPGRPHSAPLALPSSSLGASLARHSLEPLRSRSFLAHPINFFYRPHLLPLPWSVRFFSAQCTDRMRFLVFELASVGPRTCFRRIPMIFIANNVSKIRFH